jgi:hypothetical protein
VKQERRDCVRMLGAAGKRVGVHVVLGAAVMEGH